MSITTHLEDADGVLGIEGEQGTRHLAQLGQLHLHAPQLTLVAEAILADNLQLVVEAFLLIRTTGPLEALGVCG